MKDTAAKKPIIRQSKDYKQVSDSRLKNTVLTSKKKVQDKESPLPRTLHRYTHLPSLRYGVTPSQTNFCSHRAGPLRLTYGHENTYSKARAENDKCSGDDQICHKPGRDSPSKNTLAVRRVHFAEFPPKNVCSIDLGNFNERRLNRIKGTKEVESLMRNRIGIFCTDGGSDSVSSSQLMRHGSQTTAVDLFFSAVKSEASKLGSNVENEVKKNHGFLPFQDWLRGHSGGRPRRRTINTASYLQLPPLLKAAKNGSDAEVLEILRKASVFGIASEELNATDRSGRTALSYIASNGNLKCLKSILKLPKIDVNKADNEGNTPLHFASQAGQVEAVNIMLSLCPHIEIDAKNSLGFTPLMKAALQGRTKCAKLLLLAGASPNMRDSGRGLKAEQWAKFCGRHSCAEMIEKFAGEKLIEKSAPLYKSDSQSELQSQTIPKITSNIKSKIQKAFRTTTQPVPNCNGNSFSVISHLTTVALCASSPVLQSCLSPSIKSLVRPLSVPKLEVTLASNHNNEDINPAIRYSSSEKLKKPIHATSEKK